MLLRNARQILTLNGPKFPRRGELLDRIAVIEGGSLLVENGLVKQVGPARRIENLAEARDALEVDLHGRVVMPGLVDSHTHLGSVPSSFPCEDWLGEPRLSAARILSAVNKVRSSSARAMEFQMRQGAERFVRHGTTTIEAKSGYGLDDSTELRVLKMLGSLGDKPARIVRTYLGANLPSPDFPDCWQYAKWMSEQMLPRIHTRGLAEFVDVNLSSDGFGLAEAKAYLTAAVRLGFLPKVHANGKPANGAIRVAAEVGAVSADGVELASHDEIELLARSATIVTLLPIRALTSSGRFADARRLIDSGAAVAIATGFDPVVSSSCNMLTAVGLACTQMGMTVEEAIVAATVNGAYALARGERAGCLQSGRPADLAVLDISDYREIPLHFGVNCVWMTMVGGDIVYNEPDVQK